MKHQLAILSMTLIIVSQGCKKDDPSLRTLPLLFARQARSYFSDSVRPLNSIPGNYRAAQPKVLHWDQSTVVHLSIGSGLLVPVTYRQPLLIKTNFGSDHYYNLDHLVHLLLYRDHKQRWHAEMVTTLPDSNFLQVPRGPFTGMKIVEDWQGNPIAKYMITAGTIKKYHPPTTATRPTVTITSFQVTEVCYSITGYNYSPDDPDNGYYWTEDGGCDVMYSSDAPSDAGPTGSDYGYSPTGGGGSDASAPPSDVISIMPGKNVIKNVADYFKCFTNVTGSMYTVTICVDQAVPGSRDPWGFRNSPGNSSSGSMVSVGHTFIILTETSGNTTIKRNVGFYPSSDVDPTTPSAQGQLNNDDVHYYNIGGQFNVNNTQFYNILNYISQGNQPGYLYNLNSNNCTSFAIHALAQGSISLPSTMGTWLFGMGNNPGDLGEDLRNGIITVMTLITNTTDAIHNNIGECQ